MFRQGSMAKPSVSATRPELLTTLMMMHNNKGFLFERGVEHPSPYQKVR
jgi:hypothetical protein